MRKFDCRGLSAPAPGLDACICPPFSKIFFSKIAWPIKVKFYVKPPRERGKKVYINGPGLMTRMAAMPIYGKKPSKSFSYRTNSPMILKLGMEHYEIKLYIVSINDDPELTLTYFTTMSNLGRLVFCTYNRPRYQVSVYRTIGPQVYLSIHSGQTQ